MNTIPILLRRAVVAGLLSPLFAGAAPSTSLHARPAAALGSEITLEVGLALDDGDPATCGSATDLAVHAGDAVNFCYTLTNHSTRTLAYHTLVDSVDGAIFTLMHEDVAPGASMRFNRIVTATLGVEDYAADWTAQDQEPGYAAAPVAFAFTDIVGSGTPLDLADDGATGVTLPFAFPFFDGTSDLLTIGNNGTLVLGTLTGFSYAFNDPLPYAPDVFMGGPIIAPFWDDFADSAGNVWWRVDGTAPNRRAIVQWIRPHFLQSGGTPAVFQAWLGEDGSLEFHYANTVFGDAANPDWDNGGSATVGLQNADASIGNQYSYDTPSLSPASALAWTRTSPTAYATGAAVHLDVAPALVPASIAVTPDPLAASAEPGGAAVALPLVIANGGDQVLEWSALEAPAARPSSTPAPQAASPLAVRKLAANAATRDRWHARQPEVVSLRGAVTEGCDESTPGIIVHDDGAPEDGYRDGSGLFTIAGYVDRFTPSAYPATFTSACVAFLASANGTSQAFQLVVYDDTGWDGGPGNLLASVDAIATDIPTTATAAFVRVDLSALGISVASGNVYIGVQFDPTNPGTAFVASDVSGAPGAASGYLMRGNPGALGSWDPIIDQFNDYHALLVRAVEQPDACAAPSDVPWLSLDASSGSVDAHAQATLTATLDPSQLAAGHYAANLCIASNDPAHPRLVVPVSFDLGDRLFDDGFDG
ncbi:hypothetical protein [Dokdonella sp.]|uniref:hypothetical protein n=1 Tax=Dokdonella sp. TaxID=2291710 RepID=UPI002F3F147A